MGRRWPVPFEVRRLEVWARKVRQRDPVAGFLHSKRGLREMERGNLQELRVGLVR